MKILIVGCERSGTSAVSNLLHLSSGKSILDDHQEYWGKYIDIYGNKGKFSIKQWLKLKTRYIVKIPGFATILDKLPGMGFRDFKTYFILRDPRDNVAALLERVGQGRAELFLNTEWLNISEKSEVGKLAMRWKKYVEIAMKYKQDNGDIEFIKYEDFYNDKIAMIKDISNKSELNFNLEKISDKIEKQFRKSWDSRIRGPGRWRADLSTTEIDKINETCGDLMGIWGYE